MKYHAVILTLFVSCTLQTSPTYEPDATDRDASPERAESRWLAVPSILGFRTAPGDSGALGSDAGEVESASDSGRVEVDASHRDAGQQALADAGVEPIAAVDAGELERNACGGTKSLAHEPGSFCPGLIGRCSSGRDCARQAEWTCSGIDVVYCACCEL